MANLHPVYHAIDIDIKRNQLFLSRDGRSRIWDQMRPFFDATKANDKVDLERLQKLIMPLMLRTRHTKAKSLRHGGSGMIRKTTRPVILLSGGRGSDSRKECEIWKKRFGRARYVHFEYFEHLINFLTIVDEAPSIRLRLTSTR